MKEIYEEIIKSKEEIKSKISKIFTKLRDLLNEREDQLLLELNNMYNNLYFKEDLIKKGEEISKQINSFLEKGKILNNEWENNNKLISNINDCINIENNIKNIIEINGNIDKCNSQKINIKFKPENQENTELEKNIKIFGQFIKEEIEENEKNPIINFNSLIVKDNQKIKTLKNWISEKNMKAELLYRLSKDGESFATFHQLCDNKGPTISLFETINGTVIGFYSPLNFDSNYGNFKQDMDTFIFNLDSLIKFEKISNDGSIYCSTTFGPYVAYFGMYGFDVKDMKKCYYNPASTKNKFKNGNNIIPNDNKNIIFDLKEVEIWKIIC